MDCAATHRGLRLGAGAEYLVRDRDRVYGEIFTRRVRAMGIRDRPTAPRSPWQNGHAERLIGSIRRECLDHVVVFGERHLRHLLRSYTILQWCSHTLSLDKDAPPSRAVQAVGRILPTPTSAVCTINMFGFDFRQGHAARIEWCDTLNSPALIEGDQLMKFDVVVANPPFSLDKWGARTRRRDQYNRFWRGIPPKSKGDYAFITHMIEIAKRQTGRVAVIVPHGVLFRGGAEGKIRQTLIEENLLDAVVGLPANLFTTTGIPVAILVFDRSREQGGANEDRKDVLFIDASREFSPGKAQNILDQEHIVKILYGATAMAPTAELLPIQTAWIWKHFQTVRSRGIEILIWMAQCRGRNRKIVMAITVSAGLVA